MANGVTFAGQPAVLDFNKTIEKYVAQRWPASRWPFSQGRNDIPLAANPFGQDEIADRFRLPYPPVPAPRINEVVIPTGASRYGRGLFLFGRTEMTAIAASVWGYSGDLTSIPTDWGSSNAAATLRIEYDGVFTWQMRALPPVLVDGSGKNELWLLPLVDARYQIAQLPADVSLIQGDQWSDVISDHASSIDSDHGDPDRESFADPGVSKAAMIDAAILSVGLRAVPSSSGTLTGSTPSGSTATLTANLAAKPWFGGQVPKRALPDKVTVIGRVAIDHFSQCGKSHKIEKSIGGGSSNAARVVVHTPWFVEHFRQRVSDDAVPEVDSGSLASFEALATQIAADVAAWGALQYAFSIPGVYNWGLSGHDDYMAIRVGGTDQLDSVSTHVHSLPPDFAPLVHLGQRPDIYVHPNDSAVFTLTEDDEDETGGWIEADIGPVDGHYAGSLINPVLVKCDEISTDLELKSGSKLFAHYQCEQGWFADPPSSIGQLPAWEIEATLDDVLYATDESGTATFTKIRSVFPHTGDPPGVDPDTGEVEFENPWRLDALCESKLILQRIENASNDPPKCEVTFITGAPGSWSYTGDPCPPGWECPPLPEDEPDETTVRQLDCIRSAENKWELRKVEKYKARWIKIRYETGGSGDYDVLDFWEGDDPESCGEYVNVLFPLGEPCMDCDVVACYDPFTDSYRAVSSPSSMLGEAEDMQVVQALAHDGCGINYIRQSVKAFPCDSEPSLVNTEPDLFATSVLSGVELLAKIEECSNVCRYEWDGTQWWLTETCSSGSGCTCASIELDPPGTGDPHVLEFPCDRDDGQTPRPASLNFTSTTILVCGATAGGGYSIPIVDCPEPEVEE